MTRPLRLTVEPHGATRTACGCGTDVAPESLVLDFRMERQERARWCWAAIAVSLARYYGRSIPTQSEVAALATPRHADPAGLECRLDLALRQVGCFSHWSAGRPRFERITAEIATGRPVCLRVEWHRGGSHYVVVAGYDRRRGEIVVADPMSGLSVQTAAFPAAYRGIGGCWTETYWTASDRQDVTMSKHAPAISTFPSHPPT